MQLVGVVCFRAPTLSRSIAQCHFQNHLRATMSEYRKFATRNKFGKKRKRACYNFEKCPDPAKEPSVDYLPAASNEGRGNSKVDSSEPRESELSLTASPANGDRRSTVRHDTRMVLQAELLQQQKQAEDKLQRLAQTSATKRKLHVCKRQRRCGRAGGDGVALLYCQ